MDVRRSSPLGLLALLLVGPAQAAADDDDEDAGALERIAVLELTADPPGAVEPHVLRLLADNVRGAVAKELDTDRYFLVSRENQAEILESFDVSPQDFCEAAANCEVKAARMIGARYLFSGTVTRLGQKYVLTLKLFHAGRSGKEGRLLASDRVVGPTLSALDEGVDAAARALTKKNIKGKSRPISKVRGAKRPRSLAATAQEGKPIILGSLPKEVIRGVVREHITAIGQCYEEELDEAPGLSGKIVIKWIINGAGKVSNAKVAATEMKNERVERCLVEEVRGWRFPEPKGGGIVIVNYPFIFRR